MTDINLSKLALTVIETEACAISALAQRIDEQFVKACEYLLACQGRIVVIGMGKSGHIGGKIAATLASTGTPAFFVHPGEASHGDMGMITAKDVVLAISNSGSTPEILTILPLIKRINVPLICLTGRKDSILAQEASVNLDVSVAKEACPLGLAPTASTTAALVMGDALAIALLNARGFTSEDFALSHPGGRLGRRLLLRIDDLMHTGDAIPRVSQTATLSQALLEMNEKQLGMTTIVDNQQQLVGIFTDGDLRRALDKNIDIHTSTISSLMSTACKTIQTGLLAAEALAIMEKHQITALVVLDSARRIVGIVHMHALLRAGV